MKECKQCGTCCEKSGATLHMEDKYLVDSGKINPTDLVTLRKGEIALDPFSNEKTCLEKEIIKIKGSSNSWQCIYFDGASKKCSIYEKRPVECRLLKCWDTKPLASIINKNLLSREALFSKAPDLYDLISTHEKKCSYKKVKKLLQDTDKNKDENALKELKEIILFDINLREIMEEKHKNLALMQDLILGRCFQDTLPQFKYKIKYNEEEGLVISPFKINKLLETI